MHCVVRHEAQCAREMIYFDACYIKRSKQSSEMNASVNDYHDVMTLDLHLLTGQFLAFQLEANS